MASLRLVRCRSRLEPYIVIEFFFFFKKRSLAVFRYFIFVRHFLTARSGFGTVRFSFARLQKSAKSPWNDDATLLFHGKSLHIRLTETVSHRINVQKSSLSSSKYEIEKDGCFVVSTAKYGVFVLWFQLLLGKVFSFSLFIYMIR